MIKSLDPRVNRLSPKEQEDSMVKGQLDQLETYEIFLQLKEGRPFAHVGIIHAANEDFAFLFAKEQFSRRLTCNGIWVVRTQNVYSTPLAERGTAYDEIQEAKSDQQDPTDYEIFHLPKRGKQQMHAGTVRASGIEDALWRAKVTLAGPQQVFAIWVIRSDYFYRSSEEDADIWATLPDKKYRDAIDYKGQAKIDELKNRA